MSTAISPPSDPNERIDALVDQLVPRPGPPWRRFAAGLCLTALVVAGGLSWRQGLITPNPTSGISYSGGRQPTYVADRNAIAVSVYVPNHSNRSVRLTALALRDARGARLVDVGARLQHQPDPSEENCTTTGGVTTCTAAAVAASPDEFGPWPSDVQPLPITVPAGRSVDLYLLLDPTSCQGPDLDELPWGEIDATFDFGDGGLSRLVAHHPGGGRAAGDRAGCAAERRHRHSGVPADRRAGRRRRRLAGRRLPPGAGQLRGGRPVEGRAQTSVTTTRRIERRRSAKEATSAWMAALASSSLKNFVLRSSREEKAHRAIPSSGRPDSTATTESWV